MTATGGERAPEATAPDHALTAPMAGRAIAGGR
jgi:hypothetical protein